MNNLPVLKTPSYHLTIPSMKKKIRYRPFLVGEEKILQLIKESNDTKEMLNGMIDIINSCTFNKIVDLKLSLFDIEYIFLQLRSKSIGEIIELPMRCKNKVSTTKDNTPVLCNETIKFEIDLSTIKVKFPKEHTKNVVIEDKVGITFKYPDTQSINDIESIEQDPIKYIASLIECIFDENTSYDASMLSEDDLCDWLNKLTRDQFKNIQDKFLNSMPTLEHTIEYKCPKCGIEDSYTFKGISDFF